MKNNNQYNFWVTASLLFVFLGSYPVLLSAQSPTRVQGIVTDVQTNDPLAFVSIAFQNTNTGTVSELDGTYTLTTTTEVSTLVVSYVGYEEQIFEIEAGKNQTINIRLQSGSLELETVTVSAKKERYSKKNNPAVELMREVMAHKKENGLNGQAFYSFDEYEKVEVDVNNISEKFRNRKLFESFDFIWNYLDSTTTDSQPFLPILLRETNATVYHQATPNVTKRQVHATRISKLDKAVNTDNLDEVINTLYQEVDIYENQIILLKNQFLSPLAPLALDFYRFYIVDTVEILGTTAINISFIPKNQSNFGFTGNLYISQDEAYQVLKVSMGIFGNLNLNFVRDIDIDLEFQPFDSVYVLKKSKVVIDYALNEQGLGIFGTKTVHYQSYSFAPPNDPAVFDGVGKEVVAADAEQKTADYWLKHRPVPLTASEAGIYQMVDTLATVPTFKRFQKITKFLISGFIPVGQIDIGPYATIASFNNIEGLKLKLGGETNLKFSEKWLLQGYAAYGFKDRAYKYGGYVTYTFNERYRQNPLHQLSVNYTKDTNYPGYEDEFIKENNFLLSFKWGEANQMLLSKTFKLAYLKETAAFEWEVAFLNIHRQPYGMLSFEQLVDDTAVQNQSINTSAFDFKFKFAPNQQFLQRGKYRYPIYNQYPIFRVGYQVGINNLLGGQYGYQKISASVFKRFALSIFGHTNVEVSAGKIIGNVPYILLHIPLANQTYAYRTNSYNLMNFMEFVGDQYVNINFRHYFKGFFFNRIPLIKKLEWREVISAKLIWGSVSDKNNPALHPDLIQFPVNAAGQPTTYALSQKPYVELGFGISNIAKFFRVDIVRRLNYLDHPNVPQLFGQRGLALRLRFDAEF